jgi:hypothetical protein
MKYVAVALFFIFSLVSCKKKNDTNPDGSAIVKGSITLSVTVMHHTWPVTGISVFMKKNAEAYPGPDTTLYEWTAQTDASGIVLIRDLFPGKYFLYAKGFDSTFGANVAGYLPIDLNSSTVQNNEAYFTMAVSE